MSLPCRRTEQDVQYHIIFFRYFKMTACVENTCKNITLPWAKNGKHPPKQQELFFRVSNNLNDSRLTNLGCLEGAEMSFPTSQWYENRQNIQTFFRFPICCFRTTKRIFCLRQHRIIIFAGRKQPVNYGSIWHVWKKSHQIVSYVKNDFSVALVK